MRANRKALFLTLILLAAILQPFLAIGSPGWYSSALGDTEILWVSDYTGDLQNWDERNAPFPYLADEDVGYIHEVKSSGATEGYFGFEDPSGNGTINGVTLYVECYGQDTNDRIVIYVDCSDGSGWVQEGTMTVDQTSYDWETLNLLTRLDSWADIQSAQIYFNYQGIGGGDDIYVRRAYLYIDYEYENTPDPPPETPPDPAPLGNPGLGDYGENETYLGQVVDSYLNNDSVQATYNAIHNSTLECMEISDYENGYVPQPQQVLFGGYYDLLSPTLTEYNSLIGGLTWTVSGGWRFKLVTTDGIIKNLRVKLSGAPGAGKHYTFTLYVNGFSTALTFDISDTETTGGNMVTEINVEPMDTILIRCAPDGTPNAVYATWTSVFMADAECESILSGGSGYAVSNTATEYVGLVGGSSNYGTIEASQKQVCPTSGTIKNFYVEMSKDPGTAPDAYRWTLRKGGVSQSLTVTITADDNTGSDWVNSVDVVAGDILTIMVEPLNTPSEAPYARWGFTFVADINGESILLGGSANNLPQVATEYHQITPAYATYSWTAAEAQRYQLGQVFILKKFYVTLAGSPGAGNNYNFTIRTDGSDSNVFTVISDAETSGNSGVLEYAVSLNENLNLRVIPTSSPTVRDAYYGMVCYIEPTEAPFGVYYTKEMLDGDIALNMMYNVSIPEDTDITMEISEDNSTWVDHDNQSGYEDLIAGFESVDLRDINATAIYFRFNMTSDGISTPRVYQIRLVTITDVVLGGANIPAINEIVFNTTIAETVCEIYGDFSDAEGLSGYIFWNNATSAPGGVNSSFTALTGVSNSTMEAVTLPSSGTQFGVAYYVNDTDGNWGVDTLIMFPTILNETEACAGWLSGWDNRVKITIDSGDIGAGLSNFPVLIHLSDSSGINGDNVTFVFDEVGANSLKIAVTLSDGITECYVEIEKWDIGYEEAWVWAKITSIGNVSDTEIYLYYDNGHADNGAYVGLTNSAVAENVWDSDFLMVQHQAGDSSPIRDSTSSDTDMTEGGDPTYLQAGPIDGEIDYDGNDYHLSAINVFDAIVGTDEGTMSLWIKTTTSVAASHVPLSIEGAYVMMFRTGEGGLLKTFWSGTHSDSARTTTQINTGAQFYIVSTYDGSNQRVYVNGNLEATDACNLYDITALNRTTGLASDWTGLGSIDANIDDVRVSKINRSPSWIVASYETGRDDLLDFGAADAAGAEAGDTIIMGGSGIFWIILIIIVPIVAYMVKRR